MGDTTEKPRTIPWKLPKIPMEVVIRKSLLRRRGDDEDDDSIFPVGGELAAVDGLMAAFIKVRMYRRQQLYGGLNLGI